MSQRTEKLVDEMTLEEKTALVAGVDLWHGPGVERLGIPALKVTDGPSGARGEQCDRGEHEKDNEWDATLCPSWTRQRLNSIRHASNAKCEGYEHRNELDAPKSFAGRTHCDQRSCDKVERQHPADDVLGL